jgi:hypothetical protein
MTAAEFKTAHREAGCGVTQGWIVDVSGKCSSFATLPRFNKAVIYHEGDLRARRRD